METHKNSMSVVCSRSRRSQDENRMECSQTHMHVLHGRHATRVEAVDDSLNACTKHSNSVTALYLFIAL